VEPALKHQKTSIVRTSNKSPPKGEAEEEPAVNGQREKISVAWFAHLPSVQTTAIKKKLKDTMKYGDLRNRCAEKI
jgi:hypothetical protein